MSAVSDYLEQMRIEYKVYDHKAVFTVGENKDCVIDEDFIENKNLFLRNRKGDKHYLVTIASQKQLDLKLLAEKFNEKSIGFASPERLLKFLGLTPGSVSPFGLINDLSKQVIYLIDQDVLNGEYVGFHPNINTQTMVIKTIDFSRFIESTGRSLNKQTFK